MSRRATRRRKCALADLLRCESCHRYTLKAVCPACGGPAGNPHPAKFSPKDPYGKYRRMMKKEAGIE